MLELDCSKEEERSSEEQKKETEGTIEGEGMRVHSCRKSEDCSFEEELDKHCIEEY